MKQSIYIIGNSGAAKECYWLLDAMFRAGSRLVNNMEFAGFLAWKGYPAKLGKLAYHDRGDADKHEIQDKDLFIIGIGKPSLREVIYGEMKGRGAAFMTLVHPLAEISPDASIGEANIFQRNSTVFSEAIVGKANYFNGAANASHDAVIGDFNFVGPFALVLGNAAIGSCNMIGSHAIVMPRAKMGDGNVLAPASVLYRGCGDNCHLAGNPALGMD